MRLRYQRALDSLNVEGGLMPGDARITAFLKGEKFNPLLKLSKPRMIMARKPRFNLELASYLKPFEHAFWKRLKGTCAGVTPTRVVGKGLNGSQRAHLIARKMGAIGGDCVVFEVDGKSFEAHVTSEDLRREHSVYRAGFKGDQALSWMLDCQLTLKGYTSCGVKYRREGARASGDYNTGLGNTIIMLTVCRAAMRYLRDVKDLHFRWDLLADGDNCLIFVEGLFASQVHSMFASAVSAVSSQELAVENPVSRLENVVFGQSKPCWDGESYRMVRDPTKVLSNSFSSYRHYRDYNKFGVKVLKSVSQCELALAIGIPVLQAYFATAVSKLGDIPDLLDPTFFLEARLLEAVRTRGVVGLRTVHLEVREPTDAARLSFSLAWGISPTEQVALEKRLSAQLTFPHEQRWLSKRFGVTFGGWQYVNMWDGPDAANPGVANFIGS